MIINDRNFFAHENDVSEHDDGWLQEKRSARPAARPARDWEDNEYVVRSQVNRQRDARRTAARTERRRQAEAGKAAPRDVFQDDMFNVNAKQKFSDKYEDEVFNVTNLPKLKKPEHRAQTARQPQRRQSGRQRSVKP